MGAAVGRTAFARGTEPAFDRYRLSGQFLETEIERQGTGGSPRRRENHGVVERGPGSDPRYDSRTLPGEERPARPHVRPSGTGFDCAQDLRHLLSVRMRDPGIGF